MTKKINNINGYILAGGKSSRMGKDKGLINYNGKAIIEYILLLIVSISIMVSFDFLRYFSTNFMPDNGFFCKIKADKCLSIR